MELKMIGIKIKNLRIKKGLTLDELAQRSKLTKGFLSQVERGMQSPSLDNLNFIIEALGTTLSNFFKEEKKIQNIFSINQQSEYKNEKYAMRWLVPTAQSFKMEPIILKLEKNEFFEIEPFDGEIFGYLLEGNLEIKYSNQIKSLIPKYSFYFLGNKPIIMKSKENMSKIIMVMTPPNF